MKCCPASFCLKDSSCPSPSPPPNIPPHDFRAKIRGGPRPWGAPRHEGLLQRCQGTGRVRCSRGPGSTAQFPGLSSHRFYLFRERDCIRFPDKVASSFAEKQGERESQPDETTPPYTQPRTPQNQRNVDSGGLRQQSVQLAQLADEEETQEGPCLTPSHGSHWTHVSRHSC